MLRLNKGKAKAAAFMKGLIFSGRILPKASSCSCSCSSQLRLGYARGYGNLKQLLRQLFLMSTTTSMLIAEVRTSGGTFFHYLHFFLFIYVCYMRGENVAGNGKARKKAFLASSTLVSITTPTSA